MSLLATLFDPTALIAAFAAGAFGAALGALNAFIFTGFMVIAGEAANLATRAAGKAEGVDPATLGTVGITGSIAFGSFFSPAISFGGGVAAVAYAAKKGYVDTGFDYHGGKDIAFALGNRPDVLAVGGVFGILGYWLTAVSAGLGLPWDPIALAVVLSALVARAAFGYDVVGKPAGEGYLDMTPFERGEMRVIGEAATSGEGETEEGERFAVEPWLPHQYGWAEVSAIGVVVGLLGGFAYLETGSQFLAFGISAASLIFLSLGIENIPVTHHMSLPASTAAAAVMASGSGLLAGGPTLALLVAGVFGLVCALFGEVFQRVFYAHGDTHVDPPAAGIVFGSLLVAVCYVLGIFPGHGYVPVLGL